MSYVLTVPYTDLNPQPPNAGLFYSPRLPTLLEWNNTRSKFLFHSVVDSGADNCIFPASFGFALGLKVDSGTNMPSSGFGGDGACYYHQIMVRVLIEGKYWKFKCNAGFSEQMDSLGIGLLGRHGFFELFEEVTFDQRNKLLKLKVPGEKPKTPDQTSTPQAPA